LASFGHPAHAKSETFPRFRAENAVLRWLRLASFVVSTPSRRCDDRPKTEISGNFRQPAAPVVKEHEEREALHLKAARCAQMITGAQRAAFLSWERGKEFSFSISRAARK
jgi:hypothetical protein